MEDYIFITLGGCFSFLVLYGVIKLVHEMWWKPRRMEKMLRQQGIRGSSYRVINGDISVMNKCDRVAASKAITLNHQIVPRVFPFYHNMIQQYGEVSLSWFGRFPRLIIGDNELVRSILLNKKGHIRKPPRSPLVKLLGIGLTSLEGEIWTQRRKVVTPAFLHDKLKALVPSTFLHSCSAMIDRWQKLVEHKRSCEIDASSEFDVLTGDVIARAAFGSNYQEGKKIFDLQHEIRFLVNEAANAIYIPGFRFIPTQKNKRRYDLDVEIKSILMDMIEKKGHAIKDGKIEGSDLLSLLLEFKQHNNSLTNEDIIEECKLFYFAGHVTTSNLLAWTMVCLSMDPFWQEKARDEVLHLFGKRAQLDFEDINRLKIVAMILKEVLRLYPPLPVLYRYTKCETKIGNMTIPAGVELVLQVLHIHHDNKYWEKAEEFNPARFADGISNASNEDHAAFYPFGWGPRICVGQNFAYLQAKMALSKILQNFSFHLSPSYSHAPSNYLTLKPIHGAPVIIHRISDS
ncbi:hypothetical protein HN51_032422 [Arachis hypogaea]|uniref:Cytochrome P450 CYP72A616-like isoform X1 n=2 Tax=Arachis TaxID=3817 RepID=A0A6P4C9S5_ARADU|nr:cytochrome P450 CYP72A616-like isoform X1 [Arachis duranensis]XP_025623712.1 cytochrome P450 CYP72A219 [Arachis hypogaea]QHO16743.1 Cytochrome P450 [Arachis hypogaea]